MNSLNAQQNKVMANDLICSIGDSLDERHMNWSDKVDRFEETALDVVCDAMSTLTDILKIMAQVSFNTYKEQVVVVEEFVVSLVSAGYETVPFPLPSKSMKGGRMSLQRKRDELKAAILSCELLLLEV